MNKHSENGNSFTLVWEFTLIFWYLSLHWHIFFVVYFQLMALVKIIF